MYVCYILNIVFSKLSQKFCRILLTGLGINLDQELQLHGTINNLCWITLFYIIWNILVKPYDLERIELIEVNYEFIHIEEFSQNNWVSDCIDIKAKLSQSTNGCHIQTYIIKSTSMPVSYTSKCGRSHSLPYFTDPQGLIINTFHVIVPPAAAICICSSKI